MKKQAGSAYARQALLPEGFRDQLAPKAEQEATLVRGLVDTFLSHGYDRVAPPLVEYEDSLLVGAGATKGSQMFRLMDPDTQRMMAVRADMTIQMARLAATRLTDAPRPLRLAYSGNVMRTKGSQMRPTRQFVQAGVELVGCRTLEAELEVIAIAVEALNAVGISDLSLDLTVAPLVPLLCDTFKLEGDARTYAVAALEAKDMGGLAGIDGPARPVFETLLKAAGPASQALTALDGLQLKGAAGQLVGRLARLADMVAARLPDLPVTIDPCESHGFEYKSGIGFALFAKNCEGEVGRGGRYQVTHPDGRDEEATGFSVYLDALIGALPAPEKAECLFLPFGTKPSVGKDLRKQGWRTVQGLESAGDEQAEARRLGCTHILLEDAPVAV
jgi:ATP phosphoribosyltransferase regulatory subunit